MEKDMEKELYNAWRDCVAPIEYVLCVTEKCAGKKGCDKYYCPSDCEIRAYGNISKDLRYYTEVDPEFASLLSRHAYTS